MRWRLSGSLAVLLLGLASGHARAAPPPAEPTRVVVLPVQVEGELLDGASGIDAGVQLGDDAVLHDFDGDPRDPRPDVGADEN